MEHFKSPLKLLLKLDDSNSEIINYEEQIFLGYKPLVFGLTALHKSARNDYLSINSTINLEFADDNENTVAKLILNRFEKYESGSSTLFLYEGVHGTQNLITAFHKLTNNLKYKLTAGRTENVYLEGNLYQQGIIAYSIPRKISLVTVSDGTLCNIFPSDLNGFFDSDKYVVSLRKGGKANEQVIKLKNILAARMPVNLNNEVYGLGKNHMSDLQEPGTFSIESFSSVKIGLPVPKGALSYIELKLIKSNEKGIHNIHFFDVIHSESIDDKSSTLSHIHRFYADWRKRNAIDTNFIFRN